MSQSLVVARNDTGFRARDTRAVTASGRPIRVVVDLDAASQPIRATLTGPDGSSREYVGWLALIAALEALSADAA